MTRYDAFVRVTQILTHHLQDPYIIAIILEFADYAHYFPGISKTDMDWSRHIQRLDGLYAISICLGDMHFPFEDNQNYDLICCFFCNRVTNCSFPYDHVHSMKHKKKWASRRTLVEQRYPAYESSTDTILSFFNMQLRTYCLNKRKCCETTDYCIRLTDNLVVTWP